MIESIFFNILLGAGCFAVVSICFLIVWGFFLVITGDGEKWL